MVTGSAKLNIFQKGGDSLMGRYLLYRMHPFSVNELLRRTPDDRIMTTPKKISAEKWNFLKRSLVKEPKIYLWDWSDIADPGAKLENLVAAHLHKAVHFWTDTGLGDFGLFYLRDKEKNEVDFLVTRDNAPWFLVEVKSSDKNALSKNLLYFQQQIKAPHAFQIALNKPFVDVDCFTTHTPVIVPLLTFLSQLV